MWYHTDCLPKMYGFDENVLKMIKEINHWKCPQCVMSKYDNN